MTSPANRSLMALHRSSWSFLRTSYESLTASNSLLVLLTSFARLSTLKINEASSSCFSSAYFLASYCFFFAVSILLFLEASSFWSVVRSVRRFVRSTSLAFWLARILRFSARRAAKEDSYCVFCCYNLDFSFRRFSKAPSRMLTLSISSCLSRTAESLSSLSRSSNSRKSTRLSSAFQMLFSIWVLASISSAKSFLTLEISSSARLRARVS